jgi:hypothetical protein
VHHQGGDRFIDGDKMNRILDELDQFMSERAE